MATQPKAGFNRIEAVAPSKNEEGYMAFFTEGNTKAYDVIDMIECIVDRISFDEFKEDYGKTIVCGYARIDGWAVGIVANQRLIVKSKKGEMQMGGVIYNDSADKAARFIMNCNQKENSIGVFAGCYRLYGRQPQRAQRHYKRWRQNGKCSRQFGGSKNYHHHRQLLWCRQLCHVRKGL